ncbi:MAG: transporter permease [Ramlibacter sp.]|nr:transporter permease [Ramlibacter sp.]
MTRLSLFCRKAIRLAIKEWLLLLRNPHGLAVLFLMPAAFVLVMSFTLKNTLVAKVDLPETGWVLEDKGVVAAQWTKEWLERNGGRRFPSREALQAALKARQVEAGVVVAPPAPGVAGLHSDQLEMWLGNLVQPAAAARLRTELSFSVAQAQAKIAAAQAGPFASVLLEGAGNVDLLSPQAAPKIRYLYEIESGRKMTAVQQTVPAWLIFGMFFVVIPIAGVLIQERNEGTLARLATFKVAAVEVLAGKMIAFMALNWVQLGFMLLVGHWLVPLLGGDALNLEIAPLWFVLMVAATSAAAVGLALLIAACTSNFDHAAALGGGVNVILGAIAGVMVPRMLMPPGLQKVSEWTPMGWALDGMQSVFLGDPTAGYILPRAGLLLGFAAVCLGVSWWTLRQQGRR